MDMIRTQEQLSERKWMSAAEGEGHKFFEVKLVKDVNHNAEQQAFWGVQGLRYFEEVTNAIINQSRFTFYETGVKAIFKYDEIRFGYFTWLLDDKKGFNRQFLASHWDTGEFEILDSEIREDVKKRAEQLRHELATGKYEAEKKKLQESAAPKKALGYNTGKPAAVFQCAICGSNVLRNTRFCPRCRKTVEIPADAVSYEKKEKIEPNSEQAPVVDNSPSLKPETKE